MYTYLKDEEDQPDEYTYQYYSDSDYDQNTYNYYSYYNPSTD
jgi:hypothetical protein